MEYIHKLGALSLFCFLCLDGNSAAGKLHYEGYNVMVSPHRNQDPCNGSSVRGQTYNL